MMKHSNIIFVIIFFSIHIINNISGYEIIDTQKSSEGILYFIVFENSPFPNQERQNGYYYKGKYYDFKGHYDDSTTIIFLPYKLNKKESLMEFVFFFHGWNTNIKQCINDYNLIEQFTESKKDGILILPETAVNAPDGFCGNFSKPNIFNAYLEEIHEFINEKFIIEKFINDKRQHNCVVSLTLTTHSGGYKCLSNILKFIDSSIKINRIYLFDALYSDERIFARYINTHKIKFINIVTKTGGTWQPSLRMVSMLKQDNLFIKYSNSLSIQEFYNNKIIFLFSSLQHDDIPKIFFSLCLKNF